MDLRRRADRENSSDADRTEPLSTRRFGITGTAFLYVLPVLAIVAVSATVAMNLYSLSVVALYLAIPMLVGPLWYLRFRRSPCTELNLGNQFFLLLVFIYTAGLLVSVVLLCTADVRPFAYYVVIGVIATSIFLEVLLFSGSKRRSTLILTQTIILSLDIIWGVTLKYHQFIGRTDPLAHLRFIEDLVAEGHVTSSFGVYESFPLWHIQIASLYAVIDGAIPLDKLMFLTNGVIYAAMLLLVYTVTLRIFRDSRIALLASLFVCLNPDFIIYGMASISRSVESFLVVFLILLLFRGEDVRKTILAASLIPVIIAYHTASMPYVIVVVLAIAVVQSIYRIDRADRVLTSRYLVVATAMTVMYWAFNAEKLFQLIIKNIANPAPAGVMTTSTLSMPFNELFNYLHYALILFFVIVGALGALHLKKRLDPAKMFCLLGMLSVAVSFPGPGMLSDKLSGDFNLLRFGEYTFLFISIAGAAGAAWAFTRNGRAPRITKAAVVILFASMTILSVSNDFTASDNPLVKRPFYTFYLTEEETEAFDFVAMSADGYVMSDYVTSRYVMFSLYDEKYHLLEVSDDGERFLTGSEQDVILIRFSELNERPLKLYSSSGDEFILRPNWGESLTYYYGDSPLWNSLTEYDVIFDTGGVVAFN